ncbi:MAG: hypothetical protein K6F08_01645 [bacterium]|nr:hypothetical protein [bacterium]
MKGVISLICVLSLISATAEVLISKDEIKKMVLIGIRVTIIYMILLSISSVIRGITL